MKIEIKASVILMLIGSSLFSCKDFIEPSLENRHVTLLSPADSTASSQYATGFWWEEVEDALSYRVQIVRPDFQQTSALLVDTLISGRTNFRFTLDPGRYEWRVRAENGSSRSAYAVAGFVIHISSLKEQQLVQTFPSNNYITKKTALQLRWESLFGATSYRLQVDTMSFTDTTKLVYNEALPTTGMSFNFPKDQNYQWRVRAENATQQSKWSSSRTILYDHTPPVMAVLSNPLNNTQVAIPLALSWLSVQGARKYKLHLFKSDQVTPYGSGYPLTLSALSFSLTAASSGEVLYWKVSAVDEAGNEGEASALRSFTVQ